MPKFVNMLSRGALWALLAAVAGTALWALFTATLAPLASGEGPRTLIKLWRTRAQLGIYFGGPIALLAVIPYTLLLALWLTIRSRSPRLEQTPLRAIIASFALALPLTLIVFGSYAAPSYSLGPFWREAITALPWVLLSSWGGILLPRLMVPSLRPKHQAVAA